MVQNEMLITYDSHIVSDGHFIYTTTMKKLTIQYPDGSKQLKSANVTSKIETPEGEIIWRSAA